MSFGRLINSRCRDLAAADDSLESSTSKRTSSAGRTWEVNKLCSSTCVQAMQENLWAVKRDPRAAGYTT